MDRLRLLFRLWRARSHEKFAGNLVGGDYAALSYWEKSIWDDKTFNRALACAAAVLTTAIPVMVTLLALGHAGWSLLSGITLTAGSIAAGRLTWRVYMYRVNAKALPVRTDAGAKLASAYRRCYAVMSRQARRDAAAAIVDLDDSLVELFTARNLITKAEKDARAREWSSELLLSDCTSRFREVEALIEEKKAEADALARHLEEDMFDQNAILAARALTSARELVASSRKRELSLSLSGPAN